MSSDVSSVYPCLQVSLPCVHFPSSILQSPRTHSPFLACYLVLPLISPRTLSFLSSFLSISLPIPPTALFFPPPSLSIFWTFLLVPSVSLLPSPPLSPVMNESVGWVQFIFTEQGSNTLSVSLALHISIPTLKRQTEPEVTMGWEKEGGRGQDIHSKSHRCSSWLGGKHISLDQYSFSEIVKGERNLPYRSTNLSMWWY